MNSIRPCRDDERPAVLEIVNAAAEAYRGLIPADRWREPYMPSSELDDEIAAGVAFWGYEADGHLVGTWAAADWAIRFYSRHGFEQVSPERKDQLLREYWTILERQVATSVVLARPRFDAA